MVLDDSVLQMASDRLIEASFGAAAIVSKFKSCIWKSVD